jgi:hypothetical protein
MSFGWRHATLTLLQSDDVVSPQAAYIPVADMRLGTAAQAGERVMSTELRFETNREVLHAVRGHWRWVTRLFWPVALATLLGLFFCLLPFGLIGVIKPDPGREGPPQWVGWMIGGGLTTFLVGLALTLLLWQQPAGYRRAEMLITLADRLGLLFRWPRQEAEIVSACQRLSSWPVQRGRHGPISCSVGGLMVTESEPRLALAEPTWFADPLADIQAFVALRYTLHRRAVYAVWLAPEGRTVNPARIEAAAGRVGAWAECDEKVVALRIEGNLTNEQTCTALLGALSDLASG